MTAMTALLFSCGGNNACDSTIEVYENAAEKVLTANSKEEFLSLERELNADCSRVLRMYAKELAELDSMASGGNRRAAAKLEKLNEAKRLYRTNKAEKRKSF